MTGSAFPIACRLVTCLQLGGPAEDFACPQHESSGGRQIIVYKDILSGLMMSSCKFSQSFESLLGSNQVITRSLSARKAALFVDCPRNRCRTKIEAFKL